MWRPGAAHLDVLAELLGGRRIVVLEVVLQQQARALPHLGAAGIQLLVPPQRDDVATALRRHRFVPQSVQSRDVAGANRLVLFGRTSIGRLSPWAKMNAK